MKILRTCEEMRKWRTSRAPHETVGFVPTMGALHEGHLSLLRRSKTQCVLTVVSIFVNPLQFGPKEDFAQYPKTDEKDCELLEREQVDVLFFPAQKEIYPSDFSTTVSEDQVSQGLCGSFRPGHFRGVATVVLKLFNLVQPDTAYFGQKDYQQCAVIEKTVKDLCVPIEIVRCETLREPDGLAMSSRNRYLSSEEREKARLIYGSLQAILQAYEKGERETRKLVEIGEALLLGKGFEIQYFNICHPKTLQKLGTIGSDGAVVALAAYLGKTRLIDNCVLI